MKKWKVILSASLVFAMTLSPSSLCSASESSSASVSETQEVEEPHLVEALAVTEVLEWGETVTAIRLEYSEEIWCGSISNSNEHPGFLTYQLVNDRDITNIYVNNSGKKDDIQLYGKYVFLNLGLNTQDYNKYRDQIVFNTSLRTRENLSPFYLYQNEEIETKDGNIIPVTRRIETSGEINLGVDDFTSVLYENPDNESWLYYHLYVPEGYEDKTLPLVVHYPSGDYMYTDYTGTYRGALFTHPDCTVWASEESQSENPCFVLTVGGQRDSTWADINYENSVMQQNYVHIIDQIIKEYPIDTSRIYGISLARGSQSMWTTALANPDLFAAMICTSHEFYDTYGEEDASQKARELFDLMPIWMFAGYLDDSGNGAKGIRLSKIANELNANGSNITVAYGEDGELMWNGMLRGTEAEQLAQNQISLASSTNSDDLMTFYMPGTLPQSMHWCWNATYSNAGVRNWLFSQINDSAYTPN